MELIKCRYCGKQTPEEGIYCCMCGERLARRRRESGKEIRVPKPRQLDSGTWFLQMKIKGRRYSVSADSEAECRAKAQAIKAGILAPVTRETPVTLTAAIDNYIRGRDLSPETVRGYRAIQQRYAGIMGRNVWDLTAEEIRQALKAEKKIYRTPKPRQRKGKWGTRVRAGDQAAEILARSPEEFERKAQAYLREQLGEGLSPKTLKNDKGLIGSAIASVTGHRPDVKTPKVIRSEHLFLEPEQIRDFCQAIRGREIEIPALLALSSLRRSELMHLDWTDVDLSRRLVTVAGADVYDEHHKRVSKDENKNETSRRTVPIMMDQLYKALRASKPKTGRIVTCAPDTVRRRINAACREIGAPEVGTHGLRHSFASLAAHLEMPEAIAQEIGGWANDRVMKEIYTHVAQTDRERYKNDMAGWYNSEPDAKRLTNA